MKIELFLLLFLAAPALAVFSCQPQETPSEKPPMIPLMKIPLFDYSAENFFKEAYAQMNEKDKKSIRQAVLRAAGQVHVVFQEGKFGKGSLFIQWEKLYGQEVHPVIKKAWTGPEVDGNCLHPVYLELLSQWNKHGPDPANPSIRQALLAGLNYYDDCRHLSLDTWEAMQPHLSTLEQHGLYRTDEGDWLIRE